MRSVFTAVLFTLSASLALQSHAADISDISNSEATSGLKEALIVGAGKAINSLGSTDGFFGNPLVKIPLPDGMQKAEKAMRMFGMGKQADDLVLKMNRAAELAVPEAKTLLVNAVKKMSVKDAKDILTGGEDAATQYFKTATSGPMAEKFLPIVKKATENVQLAQQYNKYAEMGSKYGLVKKEQANVEQYVTQKTLDGVYLMMAEEEKGIRRDPMGQASSILKKVFGSL
ncbi:MAG: DUF4197 domain-containing protein [Pseudomonadota bacterium]